MSDIDIIQSRIEELLTKGNDLYVNEIDEEGIFNRFDIVSLLISELQNIRNKIISSREPTYADTD